MKMLTLLLGAVFALPVTAGSAQQGPDVLDLVPYLVSEIESQVEEFAFVSGSVLLDEESFRTGLGRFHSEPITSDDIAEALGRPYEDIVDPVKCTPPQAQAADRSCEVRNRGLHLRLDSIDMVESGYNVRVTFRYTDQWADDIVACSRTEEYTLERQDGTWQMVDRKPIEELC